MCQVPDEFIFFVLNQMLSIVDAKKEKLVLLFAVCICRVLVRFQFEPVTVIEEVDEKIDGFSFTRVVLQLKVSP